jgi:hypothetical protein
VWRRRLGFREGIGHAPLFQRRRQRTL